MLLAIIERTENRSYVSSFSHNVPGLNTTSTADISFMLLIFFLVTTSMDVDKGLSRQLPPPELKKESEQTNVSKSNLMTLQITSDNRLLVDDQPADIYRNCATE